jgi:hypothetical protein
MPLRCALKEVTGAAACRESPLFRLRALLGAARQRCVRHAQAVAAGRRPLGHPRHFLMSIRAALRRARPGRADERDVV